MSYKILESVCTVWILHKMYWKNNLNWSSRKKIIRAIKFYRLCINLCINVFLCINNNIRVKNELTNELIKYIICIYKNDLINYQNIKHNLQFYLNGFVKYSFIENIFL
jgi:hypothetical protein